jgi:hypothetical protein
LRARVEGSGAGRVGVDHGSVLLLVLRPPSTRGGGGSGGQGGRTRERQKGQPASTAPQCSDHIFPSPACMRLWPFSFWVVSTGDTGLGLGRVNLVCVATERSLLNYFSKSKINIFPSHGYQPDIFTLWAAISTSCLVRAMCTTSVPDGGGGGGGGGGWWGRCQ